jgi:hypothetical protein
MWLMRVPVAILITLSVSLCLPGAATAQTVPLRPVRSVTELPITISPTDEQMKGIERWMRDYTAWKTWAAEWINKREPGLFRGSKERRQRPDPPAALLAACPVSIEETGTLADACKLLDEWRHDDLATEIIRQQIASARKKKEDDQKTVWWQHIHLDALWPMTQGTSGVYGVLGVHTTVDLTGRVQLFLAPGAILMRVPGPSGNGEWRPATDWGFSYRLADFTMPRIGCPATLHLNLARVWFLGGGETMPGVSNDTYLAGFSLTFKKVKTH